MRVSDNITFDKVRDTVAKNRSKLVELQGKAATQKRINKPSDDPVSASRVLTSRINLQGYEQYEKNLGYAQGFLEFTDQSLDELNGHLVRAKELILSQSNDASANRQSRRVVATEIQQIYDQIVQISNRKLGDRYIFGGYQTEKVPFDQSGTYQGNDGEMMVSVDKTSYVPYNLPGNKVFLGEGLSLDGISHASTKQAKTIEEFVAQKNEKLQKDQGQPNEEFDLRAPASLKNNPNNMVEEQGGLNIFGLVHKAALALKTNDKVGVQSTIENFDKAMEQVVLARAQVGSRSTILNNALDTLQKAQVDSKTQISNLEDVDVFNVVNDINKTESTLKASMETSSRLMMPSLMDFLR